MHDFMHDLAQEVAGVNCKVTMLGESNSNKAIYHLSLAYRLTSEWKIPNWMLKLKHLRTFLLPEQFKDGSAFSKSICQELISGFGCLRVLDLHNLGIRNLPSSIGKLIHLRYLNLSHTPIRELPDSITMLQNLQTLNLYNCLSLRTLPSNMGLLKNLRSLDVGECQFLYRMPSGLGKLTSLNKLPRFTVVYKNSPKIKNKPNNAKLSDLKNLNNLKGVLHIQILGELKNTLLEATDANVDGKHGLTKLHIGFDQRLYGDVSGSNHDEPILEGLKPHPNLRELEIYWYRGQKFPSWAMMGNLCSTLPNLVHVELLRCGRCQQVPCFSQLPFLKRLTLVSLQSVEYMESSEHILSLSSKSPIMNSTLFFPSLQELTLMSMDNLQGWWKVGENADISTIESSHDRLLIQRLQSMSFSNLTKMELDGCPKLISLPQCPNVEELTLVRTNETISVIKMATASPSTSTSASGSKLKRFTVSNLEDLISLPRECLHQLSSLDVQDEKLVNTEEIGKQVFISMSSSLRSLSFTHCRSLRFFAQGLEHLTAIEKLVLWNCEQLDLSPDEHIPWKYFKSLRSLHFHGIPKLLVLPSGLQHLTNLRSLEITCNYEFMELPEWISCFSSLAYMYLRECPKLTSLPEAFCNLTALNELKILKCPGLTGRCQGPNGSEWPKIQHIPLVQVLKDYRE